MNDFLSQIETRLQLAFQSGTLLSQTSAHLCMAPYAKRVRPLLVSYFAEALNIPLKDIMGIATASELIHSASLLHDDVIDNADMRRGKSSVNSQWSNSVAVLSGNHLLALAFEQLGDYPPIITKEAISVVSQMTGAAILELQMRGKTDITLSDWQRMCIGKTGSLFGFCGTAVALFADNEEARKAFLQCGHHIGQVFQLVDDLHDLKEDQVNLEASFPRIMTLIGTPEPVLACKQELARQANLAIQSLGAWAQTSGAQKIATWLEQLSTYSPES